MFYVIEAATDLLDGEYAELVLVGADNLEEWSFLTIWMRTQDDQ